MPETVKVSMCCSNATEQMLVPPGSSINNLPRATFANITFVWNTIGTAYENYTVGTLVSPVPSETNTTNNMLAIGSVTVTIHGDINGDYKVNLIDLVLLANAYGSTHHMPSKWNLNADINGNGPVDIVDLYIMANHYNQHYP